MEQQGSPHVLFQIYLSLKNLVIPDHAFFDNGLQPQNLQYSIQQAGKESIKWSHIWILDPWHMSFGWLNSWFSAQIFSADVKTTAPKTMSSKQIPAINTSCSITLFSWAPNPAPNRTFPPLQMGPTSSPQSCTVGCASEMPEWMSLMPSSCTMQITMISINKTKLEVLF